MCLGVQFWQISTSAYSMQRLQVLECKWVCLQEIAMCGGLPPLSFANPPTHSGRRREATKPLLFFLLIISVLNFRYIKNNVSITMTSVVSY